VTNGPAATTRKNVNDRHLFAFFCFVGVWASRDLVRRVVALAPAVTLQPNGILKTGVLSSPLYLKSLPHSREFGRPQPSFTPYNICTQPTPGMLGKSIDFTYDFVHEHDGKISFCRG